jgi:hypothetical protein
VIARESYEMAAWLSRLIIAGAITAAARPAFADGPNFADLLARAEAQAAAGHRWAPSGDNMTETVSAMMALVSSATPEQLAELSALLKRDATRLPHSAAGSEAVSEPAQPAAAATAEPDRAVEQPALPAVTSEPDRPVEQPAASSAAMSEPDRPVERPTPPAARFKLDRPAERPAASAATSEPDRPVERPTAPAATLEPDRPAERPAVSVARSEPDRPVERPASPAKRFEPDRPAERPAVSAARSEPDRPVSRPGVPTATSQPDRAVARPVVPAATSEPDRRATRPGAQAMATEPERASTKPSASVARRPSPRATDLLARGQEAEQLGDVSGARRFYASAVQLGSATAARNLGRLYDPVFLSRTALGGIDPDLGQARHWYELAVAMGDPDAAPLLEALALR